MQIRILIIDAELAVSALLRKELAERHWSEVTHASPADTIAHPVDGEFRVVVCDLDAYEAPVADVCLRVGARRPDTSVIFMTASRLVDTATSAMRGGAHDVVLKPVGAGEIVSAIERAVLRGEEWRKERRRLPTTTSERRPPVAMIGECRAMKRMYALIHRVAESDKTVLVTGESGTGKELVARAIHEWSARASRPFVAINCAALPENILESELFGHVKGAFTSANQSRDGLFVQASGGTLLLDEIGEMSPAIQAKLLRALQERTVRAVGADTETPFDTRILAATNRNLEIDVASRRFREDLFYRLNVLGIHVPPLRDRESDVLLLAQSFLGDGQSGAGPAMTLSTAVAKRLSVYRWPGNVRELQNCIRRARALAAPRRAVCLQDLPQHIATGAGTISDDAAVADQATSDIMSIDVLEQHYFQLVLHAHQGNKSQTARVLGINRRTLHDKLKRWSHVRATPLPLSMLARWLPELLRSRKIVQGSE